MFRNQFVNPFRYINLTLLKALRIPKFISSKFNLMTNGIALGRGISIVIGQSTIP